MLQLLKFLLCVFGVYAAIKVSIIGTKLNIKPLNCAVCLSFWIGWGLSTVYFPGEQWYEYQLYGFVASAGSWILNKYVTGDY